MILITGYFIYPSLVGGFGDWMDLDNIECVSSSDGIDEDEIRRHGIHPHPHHHSEFSSSKPRNGATNMGPTAIAPATSVHELLECPVCTNSMYPPIHQVNFFFFFFFSNFRLIYVVLYIIFVIVYEVSFFIIGILSPDLNELDSLFIWVCVSGGIE